MFVENDFGMAYLEQIMYNVWCQRKQKPAMVPKVYMGSTFKGGKRWRKDYKRHAWISLQLHILKTLTKTSHTDRSNQCLFTNIWQSSISTTVSAYGVITIFNLANRIIKLEHWCKMSLVLYYLKKPVVYWRWMMLWY